MEEQIRMLIELQGLDKEIFEKKKVLDEIPDRIKELDSIFEKKNTNLKKLEDEVKKIQMQKKEQEIDLESKEQAIKKYQSQLYQVKTNKEYTSLEKEIETIRADKSVLEENIIGILDKVDALEKEKQKEQEILKEEKRKIEEEKKKMSAEKAALEAEYNDLSKRRTEFAGEIDKNILSRYERILHNRAGLAMVPIEGDACGGCNMNLPPQVINEAMLKKELIFCGNCSRILYTK